MELRHLRQFVVLADELHFGRAAARLHMSQPPLSFSIKQLENDLGVQLFVRDSRSVKLTPAGVSFRQSAQQVLSDADLAARRARDVAANVTTRVRIGFVGSMLFRGMPEALAHFRAAHPHVLAELVELNSAEQIDALGRGQIDLGFVHTANVPTGLSSALYRSEPFVLCRSLRPGHRRSPPTAEQLRSEPLVLFSRGASPDYYERVLRLCGLLGLDPSLRHEVRHWMSVVALVSKGMGYALVPQAMTHSGVAGVQFSPLPDSPIRSDVYMVWNERKKPAELPAIIASFREHQPGG